MTRRVSKNRHWSDFLDQKGKNLGHSGEEGFIQIPLSSEFGPFLP